MSVIRKYNQETKEWEVVAASSASSISVRSESLLDEGQNETNVESVLQKLNNDVSTLKGNVSWLAEHGGGGSGGGGTVEAEIRVNGKATDVEYIVLDSSGLTAVVQSKTSGLRWNITAVADDTKIIKTVSNAEKMTISQEELNKLGITSSFQLTITATNNDKATSVNWNGPITIASVVISTENEVQFKYAERNEAKIAYHYVVGVLGFYTLYINDVQIGDPYSLAIKEKDIEVNLADLEKAGIDLQVGNNDITARLQSSQMPDIVSQDCTSRINLTAEAPVISCPSLSTDPQNRSTVYINPNQDTVLLMPYTVYFESGTFKAQIYSSKSEIRDWNEINTYIQYNTTQANASYTITSQETGKDLDITLAVWDSGKTYTETFYCITAEADYDLLDHGVTPVFSFQTFYGSMTDNQWSLENAVMTIENPNVHSSTIQADDNRSLRLQNAAYGVIKNSGKDSYYNKWFSPDAIKEFTLSICYRADFHPDDDRTILQFAQVNTEHTPTSGIIIRDHKLYIAQNTFDLEDQELMTITITFRAQSQNKTEGNVFVYINGVVEAVYPNMNVSLLIPENENSIFIAAQVERNEAMYFTDTSIYRVALFNKCLDPLQVLYDYLNDQALTHLTKDYKPDTSYIEAGLKRNFIKSEEGGGYTSLLYNINKSFDNNSDNYNENFSLGNFIAVSADTAEIKEEVKNFSVPLPLMFIDVSSAESWTWSDFITPNSGIKEAANCKFQFYDQNGSCTDIITGACDVDLQGTSTLSDAIKNLQIMFKDNVVFVPKETWFPEKSYTLKADIVDSSHSLNTSIGKFVNEEFGFTYNPDDESSDTESWYPYSKTVKGSFIAEKKKPESPIRKYFPKATLKHGIEGFPVFLILRFKGESSTDSGIHSMGIYQFILGRQSPRNFGYEIINSISGIDDSSLTYPYYNGNVTVGVSTNKGYWIEMNQNESFSTKDTFQEMDSIEKAKLTGLFWQADTGGVYYDDVAEIKYTNVGSEAVGSVTKFKPFTQFVSDVINLPVTNRRYCTSGNSELLKNTFYNCTYPVYISKRTSTGIQWDLKEGNNQIVNKGDDTLLPVLERLDIPSYSQYFVIAMFFGLIDNLMKNMPLKFYKNTDGTWEPPLLGIYDTDTGIGGDNEGELKVSESVWLSTLKNVKGVLCETSDQPNDPKTNIIGQNNKLWYYDSDAVNYTLGHNDGGSILSDKWYSFVGFLKNKYVDTNYAINSLEDLVTLYYEKYFLPQTEGCGELLFNLTYFTKYLNKYEQDGSVQNQASKLHGRRQQQIRRWMKNRVKFLDSLYTAMGMLRAGGSARVIPSINTAISSGSTETFNLKSNYPIISYLTHQGKKSTFVLLNGNEDVQVPWGASDETSQKVTHTISYSDAIQNLGNSENTLSSIYFEKVSSGALPYITVFDAQNCKNLAEDKKNAVQYFLSNNKSELREINLANTAKTDSFTYVLDLTTGYNKLQKLNLYKSCVSTIKLPSGNDSIPLLLFDVRYSQITDLVLSDQNLLTDLDLTGCVKLGKINLLNCKKLTSLTLGASQSNLTTIEISCDTFESLICTNNKSLETVEIKSSGLSCLDLSGCDRLESVSISGNSLNKLILEGCSSLKVLNITDARDSITTLNLKGTNLSCIKYNGECGDTEVLDLRVFKTIGTFNIQDNTAVTNIQFSNDENIPIDINVRFFNNTSLKRVYGNLRINVSQAFYGCTAFSIHGSDMIYNGVNMKSSDNVVKFFTEVDGVCADGKPVFQAGAGVTNLEFNVADGSHNFHNTSCTILDVYYTFYNIGKITNCYSMFEGVKSLNLDWNNSFNKDMFVNCGAVTTLCRCFYNTSNSAVLRIFSPTHELDDSTGDYQITKDDGLFSPLKSCTDLSLFLSCTIYADRFMFRRMDNTNYAIISLDYWPLHVMAEDVNEMKYTTDVSDLMKQSGSFKDFFRNLPDIKHLYRFAPGILYIDYEKTGVLKCPALEYKRSFQSTYANGEMSLEKLFKTPTEVTTINNSFTVANIYEGEDESSGDTITKYAIFNIKEGMLDKFTGLKYWGYEKSGDFVGSIGTLPFTGNGVQREFADSEFPFGIFSKNKELVWAEGFFKDVKADKLEDDPAIEIPGNLFRNNTKLQSVKALFYNPSFTFSLTSGSFENCPELKDVSYMFYNAQTYFTGSIPRKLFYHGQKKEESEVTGANLWADEGHTEYKYDPTEINDDGTQRGIDKDDLQEVTITYSIPYKTITDMSYCFYKCNIDCYDFGRENQYTGENNIDYMPFTHTKDGTGWIYEAAYNNYKQTIIWEYDGCFYDSQWPEDTVEGTVEKIDESIESIDSSIYKIRYFVEYEFDNDPHFICAPDLLRYCKNSSETNLRGLFSMCGYDSNNSANYANPRNISNFGIKGRIPPYLLKPVSNLTGIAEMFNDCSLLSTYLDTDSFKYLIPKSFFSYAPKIVDLERAFRGTTLPAAINLAVFSALKGSLRIARIFHYCRYNQEPGGQDYTVPIISEVFKGHTITTLERAFSVNDDDSDSSTSNNIKRASESQGYSIAKFSNNFMNATIASGAGSYIYDGFSKGSVWFDKSQEPEKIKEDINNYRTSD